MLTLHQLEARIARLPIKQQEIIIEIHNIVASISPNADMKLYSDGVAYYEGWRGGTIKAGTMHDHLGFPAPLYDEIRIGAVSA